MPNTQDLLAKARELGEALAAHPTVRAYHESQRAARTDAGARKLLTDYEAQLDHVRGLEAQRRPVEVGDKRKLRDLEAQMAGNEALKTLMRAQVEYVALMNQVNATMERPLAALTQSQPPQ
jgi:cell fate (sporulation/competence/biofilm development) regulator YlbF (YheA/YmcA/DUF963 family)